MTRDGEGQPNGQLLESQMRALEIYAGARNRATGILAAVQSSGDQLVEEREAKVVGSGEASHPLLVGPQGAGRTTTLALLAADTIQRFCQRVLWICSDEQHRQQLVHGGAGAVALEEWFKRSNLRWGVTRAVGLDGHGSVEANQLDGLRTDLAFLTVEEIANIHMELPGRYDELFSEVGMVVIDDLDRYTGLQDSSCIGAVRRLDARLDAQHQTVPTLWCAAMSDVASGMVTWAEDLVGKTADAAHFHHNAGAATKDQYRFYLSEFINKRRKQLPVKDLVRWLEALQIPWHLRRCESDLRDLDLTSAVSGISAL